jgi:hypothetical protein
MAQFDSADLLAQFELYANRPSTDEALTSAQKYRFLNDAQQDILADLASIAPKSQMGAPVLMTSADSGVTYTFGTDADGNNIFPLACQVYARVDGRELYASSWEAGGDFVIEGDRIRSPGNRPRLYSVGPYARFVRADAQLSASSEPVLKPVMLRNLILFRALVKWASVGGRIDPQPWQEEYDRTWAKWLPALRTQYSQDPVTANEGLGGNRIWWMTR